MITVANLATKTLADSGAVPVLDALAATSNSAAIGNGRNTFLVLRNTNVATRAVAIVVAGDTEYGQPLPDRAITLAATNGELWIPLRRSYADPNTPGRVTFTVTPFADVTAAVVQVA